MHLETDCRLAFIIKSEAWYRDVLIDEHPTLSVMASSSGGGVDWEFSIEEQHLGCWTTRVLIFADAYKAFTQMPEFFETMAKAKPSTLREVIAILDELGAVDETARINPNAPR
ncbi:hypothetical protein [Nocardia sp. NPDC057455]|uniref:hypothetical protein n=1 Tax=Nocardia sp. NPDC057455 TaxID=3346138 RepID=UPI00366C5490